MEISWRIFSLVCLLATRKGAESQDDREILFITRKDNVTSCVTNSEKPLFWNVVKRVPGYKLEQQVSAFTEDNPGSSGVALNCNIDLSSDSCTSLWTNAEPNTWKVTNSLDVELNDAVLDYRWESLKLIETGANISKGPPLDYYDRFWKSSRTLNVDDFGIGISLRAARQAQIFFCQTYFPFNIENCAVFVIDVADGGALVKTSSAKCPGLKQMLYVIDQFNATEHCSEFTELKVNRKLENFAAAFAADSEPPSLANSSWVHGVLRKNGSNVAVELLLNAGSAVSEFDVNFSTNPNARNIVLFNSNTDGDLWKFHDYRFFSTENPTRTRLAPIIQPERGNICLYIYLCKFCSLRLRQIEAETEDFLKSEIILARDAKWKFYEYKLTNATSYLEISANLMEKPDDDNITGFWAIDRIKQCSRNRFRSLPLPRSSKKRNATCQLVPKTHEIQLEPRNFTENEQSCPPNTLGSSCTPCKEIFNQANCSGIKVCENRFENPVCYCAGSNTAIEQDFCVKSDYADFLSDFPEDFQNKGTDTIVIILAAAITAAVVLLAVLIYFTFRICKSKAKLNQAGEYITPDLIETSKLPLKRLQEIPEEEPQVPQPVHVKEFEKYVHDIVDSGEIDAQLKNLVPDQGLYLEIVDALSSDYYEKPTDTIYADGYKDKKSFVIVQGRHKEIKPLNFWYNVLERRVQTIVWVTTDGVRQTKLWPELDETWDLSGVTIQVIAAEDFQGFSRNVFTLKTAFETRQVVQLILTGWETHIPLCALKLTQLASELLKVSQSSETPILIFDDTGDLNKIATILLHDQCLRMMAHEAHVDIYTLVRSLHSQTPHLTANFKYYPLLHYTVLETLVNFNSEIRCNELNKLLDKDVHKLQLCYIEHLLPDEPNRSTILKQNEVTINVYENFADITAVYVNGFRASRKFVVTSQPTRDQFDEFWNLVVHLKVSVVVTLNQHNSKFWMLNPDIQEIKTENFDNYDVNHISIQKKTITIICLKNWPFTEILPRNLQNFMAFWVKARAISKGPKRVLVACKDGVTAAGVYVTLSYLIEKMRSENVCDVPKAIRNARQSKTEFVQSKDQVEFLYQAAGYYVEKFPKRFK